MKAMQLKAMHLHLETTKKIDALGKMMEKLLKDNG